MPKSQFKTVATAAGLAIVLLLPVRAAALGPVPLRDAAFLNIGLNCRWEARCVKLQQKAMTRALNYVAKAKPSHAAIHRCNRNAARAQSRIDWIGFDHCIRNRDLGR